jgi:1-deoxy-D-xylulose-5-phosphate reductoisomerase
MTSRDNSVRVVVHGSTGSIGVNTLDVLSRHADRFELFALSANQNDEKMLAQCQRYHPKKAVMVDHAAAERLAQAVKAAGLEVEVSGGEAALDELSKAVDVDTVVCGIVGAAGLSSTLSAVESGKTVLIANKEPLVMMGRTILDLAIERGATIIPVDSEHNAIFQCLPAKSQANNSGFTAGSPGIRRILLTASGGPFRAWPLDEFHCITPAQAMAHPNWDMGPKISVDSATMMNKGLELIEACALFSLSPEQIEIIVHKQSVIHSMVEYVDGSILAQMGSPDMRIPIAHALGWPNRLHSGASFLDIIALGEFNFESVDHQRFPAIALCQHAAAQGGLVPAVMNAANEVAVAAFIAEQIAFDKIAVVIAVVINSLATSDDLSHADLSLPSVLAADALARDRTTATIQKMA